MRRGNVVVEKVLMSDYFEVRRKRQDEIENQTLNLVVGGDKIGFQTYFENLSKNYSSNATWENTLKHLRQYTTKDSRHA